MELSKTLSGLHPLMVHFPIALLFTAVAMDLYAFGRKDPRAAWVGQILLVLGTVGLMFTFITGNFAEVWAARNHIPQAPMDRHESFATATSWVFIAIVAFRSFLTVEHRQFVVYLAMAVLALGLLTVTGMEGGELVFKYAAGIQGVVPPIPATAQDLANLTLENTPDELDYSALMHHVFGWMVLLLAVWLGYQCLELPQVERIRALGPVLLVTGGIFLMIFSDFNAWPLSNELPITDKEVLAHKLIATLMILSGVATSLVRRRPNADITRMQSHLIAVLALAGGGILFTHVHTGAPFSDTAIGVYIHHFVLGVLSLSCGTVKLLELSLPERRKLWDVLWVGLLLLIAFSLITYNEGIPWYLQ
ncbi:MAG: hypothetical protein HY319_27875 [Armatimonadetes bacterium]|nr:hypothetical protein [Armatimonadota bacterium]